MNSEVGVTSIETMIGSLPGNLDYEMIHYPYNIVDLLFFEAPSVRWRLSFGFPAQRGYQGVLTPLFEEFLSRHVICRGFVVTYYKEEKKW